MTHHMYQIVMSKKEERQCVQNSKTSIAVDQTPHYGTIIVMVRKVVGNGRILYQLCSTLGKSIQRSEPHTEICSCVAICLTAF